MVIFSNGKAITLRLHHWVTAGVKMYDVIASSIQCSAFIQPAKCIILLSCAVRSFTKIQGSQRSTIHTRECNNGIGKI